jgi:hypothetical protein
LRPSSSASNKPNGVVPVTSDLTAPSSWPRSLPEPKAVKETSVTAKTDVLKKETEQAEVVAAPPPSENKKEAVKSIEGDRKSESTPPVKTTTITTVTKSGRASKPSTPALATFQEAARSRASRNAETSTNKRTKKSSAAAQAMAAHLADEDGNSSLQGDEEDAEAPDPDEPTFCYCNGVSYGEMIACDADGCEREWFHLGCVGLKVAPKGNGKQGSPSPATIYLLPIC